MNRFSKSLKEYFGKLWPVLISICCSIFFAFITKNTNKVWLYLLSFTPIIFGFVLYYILLNKRIFYNEEINHTMLSHLNEMRRIAHNFPERNNDVGRFKQTMTRMCDLVCTTIVGDKNEIKNCSEFCVVIYFVYGDIQDENSYRLIQIAHDNSLLGEKYYEILENNRLLENNQIKLKDNSSYYTIFKAYIKDDNHQAKIITKANVRKKAKKGEFQSTFVNLPNFGYSKIPYNSSCVLPILPFHNTNKCGNEMQGYMAILSTRKKAFKDSGIKNKDFESFLESVSGLLHKICTKDQSKDK